MKDSNATFQNHLPDHQLIFILLMFSCGARKSGRMSDTTQTESAQKYVEPVTTKVNTVKDTTITECLKKDCSEGIKRFYIKEI
jgi:hypothetical protein